jgi:ketosteroid isomerase-like protein
MEDTVGAMSQTRPEPRRPAIRDTRRPMSEENVEVVRRNMDAYNARDAAGYLASLSESISFRSRFSALDRGIYEGHADMRRYLAELDEVWSRYEMQVERMVASGTQVAALCHLYAVGRDSDLQLEEYPGVVYTLEARKIVAIDFYGSHPETLAAMALEG